MKNIKYYQIAEFRFLKKEPKIIWLFFFIRIDLEILHLIQFDYHL